MTASSHASPIAEQIAGTLRRIYRRRLTTTSGGNVSVRDPNGDVWITAAGVDKATITAGQVTRIDGAGAAHGSHRPSSEVAFHRAIYAARTDVGAVVHAHPPAGVAFSTSSVSPDLSCLPEAARCCGVLRRVGYATPGTEALASVIASGFGSGANCLLLQNHGVVCAGATLDDALRRFETLEWALSVLINVAALGGSTPAAGDDTAIAFHATESSRTDAAWLVRAIDRGLAPPGAAVMSVRAGDDCILLSADGAPVRVNLALHRATYRARSDVGAIIEGAPVAVTAFGVTAVPLPSRTIPESYFLLRDVPTITMTEYANAEAPLSATVPVALIRGRGAIALGTTALDAFDRLEVAEATAAAAMLTRALGPLVPLTDRAAADLAAAYFRDPE